MADVIPRFALASLTDAAQALIRSVATGVVLEGKMERTELTAQVRAHALEAGYFVEEVELFEDDVAVLLAGQRPFLFVPLPERGDVYVATGFSKRTVTFVGEGVERDVERKRVEQAFRAGRDDRTRQLARHFGEADRITAILAAELGKAAPVGWAYVLRPNEAETIPRALKSLKLGRRAIELLGMSTLQSLLSTAAWAIIGGVAIAGHAETSNLLGWALLSITATIVQVASMRLVGRFTVRAATVLRARLLEGALSLEAESLGSFGLGGLMVIATQADSFSSSIIALFIAALGALTNMVATAAVLSISPLPALMLGVFASLVVAVVACVPRVASLHHTLQVERMRTTTDMVERMLGHSTRLVQQTPNTWHDGEDEALLDYAHAGQRLDKITVLLRAAPRTYYILSIIALFVILVSQPTQLALALSIGGMTLGMATLDALVSVVLSGGSLYALFRAIRPVIGDTRSEKPVLLRHLDTHEGEGPLVELRGVGFRYPNRTRPVLEDVDLAVADEDRVLIEGPSGGGKTTLATIVTGLRKPDSGLVLIAGLDQHTIAEAALRRIVSTAPQFYKNHIFTESLAFNLLLGRAWPPEPADLATATEVATALGLGPLLQRMPSGIFQQVGETGWQLSHGEKSRVYLARALLQRSRVLVLDETFGALDPASLRQSMDYVLDQAKALVVITHR
jgi:ATP-binding cassette, subfamily B, bacterial